MPGHIFPLKAREGGVLARAGHTEGSVDLMQLAGLQPAAVICEVMNDDGSMARMPDLLQFAQQHALSVISIYDLITYRVCRENFIEEISSSQLPVKQYGQFQIRTFRSTINQVEHVALVHGKLDPKEPTLVRMHSECLTGDVFGSQRCDCGEQLDSALAQIVAHGSGVLLYLRQEGRGIGLANKIRAYALQDQGFDTVEANHQLGFAADERNYDVAAQMLRQMRISRVNILTNNPIKVSQLERFDITVEQRVGLETCPNQDNIRYLQTKREKLGHLLTLEEV